MDATVQASDSSLKSILEPIERFQHQLGFRMNYDKTTVCKMGSIWKTNAKFYVPKIFTEQMNH